MAAEDGCDDAEEGLRPPPWSRADRIALSLVLVWVALCFAQVAGFGFVNWDDRDLVIQNPLVVNPGSVPFLHHLTTPEVGYPIPVTVSSYRIEYALAGFDHPWVQHLVNLLLHLGSVALLFGIARILGAGTVGSSLAACLLGLHPAVAEPVAWLTGRKDVLALFFALATVRLALPTGGGSPRARRVARAVTFLLALFSKPVAVALTPMLVVIGAGQQDRALPLARRLARAITRHGFEIAVSLAFLPLAYLSHRAFGGLRDGEEVASSLRSAWYGLGAHLAIIVGIEPPCVRHLVALPPPFTPRFDLLPLLAVATAAGLWRFVDRPARLVVASALAGSVFAYLPSSGLVPMRRFIADSYVYPVLPGLGVALGVALGAALARRPGQLRLVRLALVPALAVGLGLMAIPSSGRFRTTSDLWADAMEHFPNDWRMCRNFAVAMLEIGGPAKSLAATDQCIERFGPANLEKNRAVALFELGRLDEAGAWMRRALDRDPNDLKVPAELLRLASASAVRERPP
jgi:tetratricopeptide (TPR) repeat protein